MKLCGLSYSPLSIVVVAEGGRGRWCRAAAAAAAPRLAQCVDKPAGRASGSTVNCRLSHRRCSGFPVKGGEV
jgi:hypothetical protein